MKIEERRLKNEDLWYSISFYKKMERSLRLAGVAAPTPRGAIPHFNIRYSAVRFSARLPAAKAASLIINKPCHFGVVPYKRRLWPKNGQFNQKKTTFL
jgi:hypothetical protein